MRANITIDQELKDQATKHAKDIGLSFSAYVRLGWINLINSKKLNDLDQALLDMARGDYETVDGEIYLQQLKNHLKTLEW